MPGKTSLTHAPDSPYWANLNGDFITGPTCSLKKPVFLSNPTNSCPSRFSSSGLYCQVSTWLGPPFMNSQITFLALAGKWLFLGARGLSRESADDPVTFSAAAADANSPSSANSAARARKPAPPPARRRKSRRDACCKSIANTFSNSFDVHKLIQTKQHLAKVGQGQLARVGVFARLIRFFLRGEKIESRSELGVIGRAANRCLITLANRIRR